jgi:hypothetical protein
MIDQSPPSTNVKCIPLSERERWENALVGIEHSFFHTWTHCHAMSLTHRSPTYLFHSQAGQDRMVCPVSERTWDAHIDVYTPYGFSGVAFTGALAKHESGWLQFMKSRKYVCGFIGINPVFEQVPEFAGTRSSPYNEVFLLDLRESEAELYDNLHLNRKRQIKKWRKERRHPVLERDALTAFFLDYFDGFMASRNASSASRFSRETLSFLLESKAVFLVGAGSERRVEAVSVFAHTPFAGEYLFNIALPDGRHHTASLIWSAMLRLKDMGVPWLNLGGGIRINDSLAAFKERFGAQKRPLKCLRQVYDRDAYRQLCEQAAVEPVQEAGYFPAFRRASHE